MTFGLGGETEIDKLVVRWPGGKTTELNAVEIDRLLTLEETQ